MLASATSDEKGELEIHFTDSRLRHLFTREPHFIFEIHDVDKSLQFVRDRLGDYTKKIENNEVLWTSNPIENIVAIDNYIFTLIKEPRVVPEKYEAVVIGFRIEFQGVVMDKPNEPAYNNPETYLIDDWR